jgi:ubiquitin-like 1-activating enzyme E1 B
MLRDEVGYGEEISLLAEGGKLLYDIDFEDLLDRPVCEIGLVAGRTLTIVDEELNRVNLEFIISAHTEFIVPDISDIPTKPPAIKPENGEMENGISKGKKRAREDDDQDDDFRKRARVAEEGDIILIDEDDDTVMID